ELFQVVLTFKVPPAISRPLTPLPLAMTAVMAGAEAASVLMAAPMLPWNDVALTENGLATAAMPSPLLVRNVQALTAKAPGSPRRPALPELLTTLLLKVKGAPLS